MDVPVAWHEAVALVRVLALSARQQSPPVTLPGISQILIDTDGNVLDAGGEPVGDDPVPALRALLACLISSRPAPPELVSLTDDSVAAEHVSGIVQFTDKLTFFSRPDDNAEVAALAARAMAYRESRLKNEALASLTRKARQAASMAPSSATEGISAKSAARRRWLLLAASLLLLGGTVLTWQLMAASQQPGTDAPSAVVQMARRVQHEVSEGIDTLQTQLGLGAAVETPRGRDRELPATRHRSAAKGAIERVPLPAEHAYGLVNPPPSDLDPLVAAQVPRMQMPEAEAAPDTTVYSAQDPEVTVPTLSRPQMPTERIEGVSQERAGELELLVGVDGRVEQARLVPASNRYQDRMMVSAAKTWTFVPANRDGHPVRYRLRIPITW